MTSCLQPGGPGKLAVSFSLSQKAWKAGGAGGVSPGLSLKTQEPGAPVSKERRRWVSQLKQNEWIRSSSALLFYSGPQRIRWCPPMRMRGSSLLSPPIQMLISSRDTLEDTPRNNVLPATWHHLARSGWQVKLTITGSIWFSTPAL